MLDLGWQEFFLIATIAVVVVGPKDLPKVIRTVVGWIRKVRSMARDFQGSIEEVAREAELDEIRQATAKLKGSDLKQSILDTVDPDRDLSNSLKEAKADIEAETRPVENSMLDPNNVLPSETKSADVPELIDEEPLKGWDADSVTTPASSLTPPPIEEAATAEQRGDEAAEKPVKKVAKKAPRKPRATKPVSEAIAEEAGTPAKSPRKTAAKKTATRKPAAKKATASKTATSKTAAGSKPRKPRAAAKPKTTSAETAETPVTEA
ncbi:MAG: twin-arginine translocase subunit TatB [Alphaproteobacteria bacterium]|jgi:sec-independent protein translocase protein TatB|nr:twin-arginine translocase subunit TatB [Alphaproteobacteria bacterium]